MAAYYNEIDAGAAAWLRALIEAGEIPAGDVDTRSIREVGADDVRGYTQCHWFAGIGGWAYALKLAGWPDDRPVWTGSCPCQPFSSAGKREGGTDDRHLWPDWARLIGECRPAAIVGEQVTSAIAHGWLDRVFDDLEGHGYTCGAACLPAAGVGAPHIRERVWFVAESEGEQYHGSGDTRRGWRESANDGDVGDTHQSRSQGRDGDVLSERAGQCAAGPTGDVNFWAGAEWIYCQDGKWRPTQPGLCPLAHGVSGRVGRLRGYGNAIVPQVAAAFITAFLEGQ